MSYFKTKQALITQLLAASIPNITSDDIAFENKDFDPSNKPLWLALYFIPATTGMMGKTPASSDEQRGVFQVSVFTSLNNNDYDNVQLQIIDSILSAFQYNSSTVYNNHKVDILESTVNNGTENESWFKRDISINYLTFSTR
ncbi:MAG: DUF4128 domain-containing protein [Colwellia sp.]|nr:DUF4128 domain-containing protein [Colwellia sp.]